MIRKLAALKQSIGRKAYKEVILINKAIDSLFAEEMLKPGCCQDNVKFILDRLPKRWFNINKFRVLFITRPAEVKNYLHIEPNMVLLNSQEWGSEFCHVHTVLEHIKSGRIFDPSTTASLQGVPREQYFADTFIQSGQELPVIEFEANEDKKLVYKYQAVHLAFLNLEDMHLELCVRQFAAKHYLKKIYNELDYRGVYFYWKELDRYAPNILLGEYLRGENNK